VQLQAHAETGLWPARSATGDDPADPAAAAGGTPAIPARGLTTTSPPARSMRCMNRMGPTGSVHPPKEVSDGQVSRLRWTARDHRRGPTPRREAPRLHTALAEVAATALNSDGGEWIEAADRRFSSAKPVLYATGCAASGFTERHYAAPAFTDSGQWRFSTQFSTQRGSTAQLRCYIYWSRLSVGIAGQSVPAAFQAVEANSISCRSIDFLAPHVDPTTAARRG
jgi:hypothetical protein